MDRRKFLRTAAGLFVPLAPAVIRPDAVWAQMSGGAMFPGPGVKGYSAGGLGLQTSCVGFWELENTGWSDSTANATTLTAVGSPTAVAGKVGNAASVGNSANALTATSNANIVSGGGSFSVSVWVNTGGSVPGQGIIFNKDNNVFAQREWGFGARFTSANVWTFTCFNTSSSAFNADATAGSGTVASGWHHLVGTFNSSSGAMLLYLDGSSTGSGGTLTGTLQSTASAPLGIGRIGSGTPTSINPLLVDQAGLWKGRILSAADVTALYNSGNGLSWAAMA